MKYVYPKLSKNDWLIVRLGGSGLGNILFPYARAISFAKKNNFKVIWPTWPSIKIGPFLRREKDKRFYNDLFTNNSGYIDGIKKIYLLLAKKKISEKFFTSNSNLNSNNEIIIFQGMDNNFKGIIHDRDIIKEDIIRNLAPKNKLVLQFNAENSICMHVRLGDFQKSGYDKLLAGNNNTSIPIEWYVKIGKSIREIVNKCVKIYVFSDGTDDELKQLLELKNIERKTFGTSIADIIAMSKAKLFISSRSTFSDWARFLGGMTTITFPGRREKDKYYLLAYDENKEIEAIDSIPIKYNSFIQQLFG